MGRLWIALLNSSLQFAINNHFNLHGVDLPGEIASEVIKHGLIDHRYHSYNSLFLPKTPS